MPGPVTPSVGEAPARPRPHKLKLPPSGGTLPGEHARLFPADSEAERERKAARSRGCQVGVGGPASLQKGRPGGDDGPARRLCRFTGPTAPTGCGRLRTRAPAAGPDRATGRGAVAGRICARDANSTGRKLSRPKGPAFSIHQNQLCMPRPERRACPERRPARSQDYRFWSSNLAGAACRSIYGAAFYQQEAEL